MEGRDARPGMGHIGAMRRALLIALAILVTTAGLVPAPARAWDIDADRAVGALAYERLTPPVKAKVDAILTAGGAIGGAGCRAHSLSDAADLAACLHGRREDFMRGVAYDAISICDTAPKTRGCAEEHCASTALKRNIAALKSPDATPAARLLALEAVVYLTAELHQPLHAADNGDRSGERFRVLLPGSSDKRLNLNAVWDQDLVVEAIGDAQGGLAYLRPLADDARGAVDPKVGDVDAWVADSHQVAVADVYGRLPTPPPCGHPPEQPERLDPGYIDYAAQVVRLQLAKAAVRLAGVLTEALG